MWLIHVLLAEVPSTLRDEIDYWHAHLDTPVAPEKNEDKLVPLLDQAPENLAGDAAIMAKYSAGAACPLATTCSVRRNSPMSSVAFKLRPRTSR